MADATPIDLWQARRLLTTLRQDLQTLVDRDPEQEIRGMAVATLDAALSAVRDLAADNVVLAKIRDVISAEAVEEGEPIRAVDVLLVVTTLLAVVPQPPVGAPILVRRESSRLPRQF
jgi:Glu-tRNA(Gln) amidotransferase subunit E-like FAD-binding protein